MATFYMAHSPKSLFKEEFLAGAFLRSFRETFFPQTPTSILVISAHYVTSEPTISAVPGPLDTIPDFDGFPEHLYEVCLFMHDPREPHYHALKRILRYVSGTLDYGFRISATAPNGLTTYTDADWAGCPDTRRSTSGYCIFLGDNLLNWSSKHQLNYPAKGAPDLARRVKELLVENGFPKINVDEKRGLDHGAWVPLMVMYPEADIPVCELSVVPDKDATYHYNLGKALAPLKDEGVLVIGSGALTNNESTKIYGSTSVASWAKEFESWLEDALVAGRLEDVLDYEEKAPHAKLAHPSPEHLYPLHVAMGAAGEDVKSELIHSSWNDYTTSYSSYKFTACAKTI